jgi:hypothetical protein
MATSDLSGDLAVIVAFIEARLAEDEAAAKLAAKYHGKRWHAGEAVHPSEGTVSVFDEDGANLVAMWVLPGDAAHIARHDPARVLREVTAKRAIVSNYVTCATADRYSGEPAPIDHYQGGVGYALCALASAWSDHPDYQREWWE